MLNYEESLKLLGLPDQNLPVFKHDRVNRLKSIDKMLALMNIAKRLEPSYPKPLKELDANDPEWEDKMIYPVIHYRSLFAKTFSWVGVTAFTAYNWSVICGNRRLRAVKLIYPIASLASLTHIFYNYQTQSLKVELFEKYVKTRALELFEENKYLFDHSSFKKNVYFNEDLKETMNYIHRQANEHQRSDFADSELMLQDFIRRYSNPENPSEMFDTDGKVKLYN